MRNDYTLRIVAEAWDEFDLSDLRARVDSPAGRSYRAHLAHCLAELGDDDAARVLLEDAAVEGFDRMPRDANLLIGLAQLADVCAALGDGERAAAVIPLLEPFADRWSRSYARLASPAPPRARWAARSQRRAGGAKRSPPSRRRSPRTARGRHPVRGQRDLAEVLLARGAPGDGARAGGLLMRRPLRPRLQHEVEGRLGGTANPAQPLLEDHPQGGLARLRAERRRLPVRVGDRMRDADQRRARVEQPADANSSPPNPMMTLSFAMIGAGVRVSPLSGWACLTTQISLPVMASRAIT